MVGAACCVGTLSKTQPLTVSESALDFAPSQSLTTALLTTAYNRGPGETGLQVTRSSQPKPPPNSPLAFAGDHEGLRGSHEMLLEGLCRTKLGERLRLGRYQEVVGHPALTLDVPPDMADNRLTGLLRLQDVVGPSIYRHSRACW